MVTLTIQHLVWQAQFYVGLIVDYHEGNVTWLSKTDAISKGLAYVYDGHVIIKVDNATYVNYGEARDSVCS